LSVSPPSDSGFFDSRIPNRKPVRWGGVVPWVNLWCVPYFGGPHFNQQKRPAFYSKGEHLVFRFDPYSAPLMKGSVPLSILNLLRDVGEVVDQLYGLKEADRRRDCSTLRGPKTMKKIGFIPISCLV